MNKWLARILGIIIVVVASLLFYDAWFNPEIPQGIVKEQRPTLSENKLLATEQTPIAPSQEEKPTQVISLTSLQDMESDHGAPVPVLGNQQGVAEAQVVADAALNSAKATSATSAQVATEAQVVANTALNSAKATSATSAQVVANDGNKIQLESLANLQQTPASTPSAPKSEAKAAQTSASSTAWIQAGSFGEKSNAERLADSIRSQSLPTVIEQTNVNGKVYYRVYVGPLAERRIADALQRLSAMGVSARQVNR